MHPIKRFRSRRRARALKLHLLLCTSLCAPVALAQDISTETTEPVTTSTADNGAPGDIHITDDGSIVLGGTEGQVAVTMDSDNNITHDGAIEIEDTNNVTGIRLDADQVGNLTISGTLSLVEDYERTDNDDDGDDDGPLALGDNRTGVHLVGGGTHTGDIDLQAGSIIAIEGNDSAGILLESALNGSFVVDGGFDAVDDDDDVPAVAVLGENSVAIEINNGVSGDVLISGGVSAQGANARGISIDGDVGGNLTVESTVAVTGFTNPAIDNYINPLVVTDDTDPVEDRIDAEDLNDNGPAVAIGGNLTNGVLINGFVADPTGDDDTEDETKDTVEDFNENRSFGRITSIGSGPALLITPDLDGAATQDIVIGPVIETVRDTTDDDDDDDTSETLATFTFEQGLINRGAIAADGKNVGYDATAIRIEGSADGAFTTEIVGGILNTGTIDAEAFEANASAVEVGAGAVIGSIENTGRISADVATVAGHDATALVVEVGADLTSLTNSGSIIANVVGESGSAYAIRDLSGGLTTVTNTGTIFAAQTDNGIEPSDFGVAVALDLSNSNLDVTLVQERATPINDANDDGVIDSNDVGAPSLVGDILFGTGNDTFTISSGTVVGNTDFGLGNSVMDITSSIYAGDVSFTDGSNSLSLTSSTLSGDLFFGGASSDFNLTDSVFAGRLISDGSLNSITATDSDILLSSDTAAVLNTFSITGDSILQVALDPHQTVRSPSLTVTGAATLGDGVSIRPDLEGISSTDFSHTFIDAGALTFGGVLDDSLVLDAPFLYDVELVLNDDARDTLDLEFTLKTSEALGLDLNQSAALAAVLEVFSADDELGSALADITEQSEFLQVYSLLLPQRTDAATRYLSSQGSAAFGALGNRLKSISGTGERDMGAWAQEYFTFMDIEEDTNVPGYNGSGLGFAAGLDRRVGLIDVAGLYVNYASGDFEEKTGGTNPVSTSSFGIGLYAKESVGPLDFSVASQVSSIDFNSRRNVTLGDLTYEQIAAWEGTSVMSSASVSSEFQANQFYARPQVSIDFFRLEQDGYTETGDERLALSVSDAETDRASASALLELGARLPLGGRNPSYVIPEFSIGYRSELSSTPYEATANFLGSTETFDILAQDEFSDAVLAGISLSTDSIMGTARFGYDVEIADEGMIHFGGATLKLKF